ncbi:MAG: YidC/Oxa1 family membrane protein insertase [Candidatus Nomurabacteria bacterium]|jgi:YidC/Oxa1 family membrane protein insertase|nr:YidC/Oxa1 family membrane protein insertase [Candidatus Nomurabacteria bacterium]
MFELIDMIIVRPIVNLLLVIYAFVGDFGLAIILFTVLVKFAMWPLVKKQLHQTRVMKEIQPELTEIKKNCKGNKQLESMQMMDLYKRKNVKPFRSMLTLIIQLPIFIALYTAIRVMVTTPTPDLSVQKSAYSFVEQLPKVQDIIVDHESFHPALFGVVDLSATAGFASISSVVILLFALAAAVTQYVMVRQQNPSKKSEKKRGFKQIMKEAAGGKEADQGELNAVVSGQMTKFMPIMMLFIMINLPGALVFYYLLTNLITVVQQKVILNRSYSEMESTTDKKILKELKAAEAEIVTKSDELDKTKAKLETKKSKQNITRITASNKKRRRK